MARKGKKDNNGKRKNDYYGPASIVVASKRRGLHKSDFPSDANSTTIRVFNIPPKVAFETMLSRVASFVAQALSLGAPVMLQDSYGRTYARFPAPGNDGTTVVTLQLASKKTKKKVKCKGHGLITIFPGNDGFPLLDRSRALAALNSYSLLNPFDGTDEINPTTFLLFQYGEEGKETKAYLLERGKPALVYSIVAVGAQLLALVRDKHNGSMHAKDWPKKDRQIAHVLVEQRLISSSDAAEAAGITWNGKTRTFTVNGTKDERLEAGAKLRALVQDHGGLMSSTEWPVKDRKISGQRRPMKPAAAAKAGGIKWDKRTSMFYIK